MSVSAATPAAAAQFTMPPVTEAAPKPQVSFRLVQDRVSDPSPIHISGMIASKQVARNATLGVGLFKMSPKKLGSGDWRLDGGAPKSRKAAVSFIMKF
jgi:hypothetical protein